MSGLDRASARQAAILNACYFVRYYWRGARSSIHARERLEALRSLGLECRAAFNESESPEDFEVVLGAIVDGLAPRDERRF